MLLELREQLQESNGVCQEQKKDIAILTTRLEQERVDSKSVSTQYLFIMNKFEEQICWTQHLLTAYKAEVARVRSLEEWLTGEFPSQGPPRRRARLGDAEETQEAAKGLSAGEPSALITQ